MKMWAKFYDVNNPHKVMLCLIRDIEAARDDHLWREMIIIATLLTYISRSRTLSNGCYKKVCSPQQCQVLWPGDHYQSTDGPLYEDHATSKRSLALCC